MKEDTRDVFGIAKDLAPVENERIMEHVYENRNPTKVVKKPHYKTDEAGRVIEYRGMTCPYPIVTDKTFLSCECTPVKDAQEAVEISQQLKTSVEQLKGVCAGLSANQLGSSLCVIAMWYGNEVLVMANPKIVKTQGVIKKAIEGCLSFPDEHVEMRRWSVIKISYQDPFDNLAVKTLKLHDFDARVFQHELDHLVGIII